MVREKNINRNGANSARNVAYIPNLKNVQTNVATIGAHNTGNITHLTGIAQGNDYNERVGDKVKLHRIIGRLLTTCNTADATSIDGLARCMIVRDKMNQGSAPTISDVLTAAACSSLRNSRPDNLRRYDVIYDHTITTGQDSASSGVGAPNTRVTTFDISLNQSRCEFTGILGSDEGPGSLWCITVSNKSSNLQTIDWNFGVFYEN